jgi:thiamine biosynthesis protein ThiS
LLAGSIFPTESHPGQPAIGLEGLAEIVAATNLPVLAIGGIGPATVREVVEAGAAGVAVIGAILGGADRADARARARALRTILDESIARRHGGGLMDGLVSTTGAVDQEEQIAIELNGKTTPLPAGTSVSAFLAERGLQDKLVVVEINGQILPRSAFGETAFAPGDRVEVVHFVGGG